MSSMATASDPALKGSTDAARLVPADSTVGRVAIDGAARATAIALLVVFVLAIGTLALLRNDQNWDRLVYLYAGLEAVVFASAGALFGTTVQRGAVSTARAEAQQAREDAAAAREDAKSSTETAAAGRALAAAVKGAGAAAPADGGERLGARRDDDLQHAGEATPSVRMLAEVARTLFPD